MLQENPLLEKADGDEEPAPLAHVSAATPEPPRAEREESHAATDRQASGDGDAENVDRSDFEDYSSGDSDWGTSSTTDDDDGFFPQQVAASSLRDHLLRQLAELNLPLRDRHIVAALIDALDDDGYLHTPLEEIAELFPAELELDPDELSIALRYVQSFEPRRARRARRCRVPHAAAQGAARVDAVPRRGAQGRRRPSAAARGARLHETEAAAPRRRCRRARRAHAHHKLEPSSRRVVRQVRGELRDPGRRRAQVPGQVDGVAQRSSDAEAALESDLRRHPDAQPRHVEPAARGATAGSEVADPQRPATLRDHPARCPGDRRAAAALLRARRGRDATRWSCARSPTCSTSTNRRFRG